jgi:hypothetical protein
LNPSLKFDGPTCLNFDALSMMLLVDESESKMNGRNMKNTTLCVRQLDSNLIPSAYQHWVVAGRTHKSYFK